MGHGEPLVQAGSPIFYHVTGANTVKATHTKSVESVG